MPLKAVLFDMDGVIVDTEPLHRKAYFKMFDDFGISVSPDLYATFTGAATKKVCQTLVDHFNINATADELAKIKRKYFKYFFENDPDFTLIPGVKELINHYFNLGLKLVLASSASKVTIQMVFEKFNLNSYFIGALSGDDLKESKPNPEIFLLAAKLAQEPTDHCIVIEDSTNGINAAHAAKIFCVAYRSEHSVGQNYTNANLVISDFSEITMEKLKKYF